MEILLQGSACCLPTATLAPTHKTTLKLVWVSAMAVMLIRLSTHVLISAPMALSVTPSPESVLAPALTTQPSSCTATLSTTPASQVALNIYIWTQWTTPVTAVVVPLTSLTELLKSVFQSAQALLPSMATPRRISAFKTAITLLLNSRIKQRVHASQFALLATSEII